ncbi:MAG: type II secretion system F family protein [Brucellaceae bacterium]|nr:type II secretion system F family protein [Notoacmeibacter sp.]MCC0028215.1 type II secretion system F family protein [Brucellaceae bacterium]
MVAEAIYLLYAGQADRRTAINRRLRLREGSKLSQRDILIQLRKERGSTANGSLFSMAWIRNLRAQSGMAMRLPLLFLICGGIGLAGAAGIFWIGAGVWPAFGLASFCVIGLPVFVLRSLRKRRHKAFGIQLPEALELITRSLKAGHPVPVAISLVAREMADPIGTEFGIVADEVTYGSDLVSALASLYDRVGHEDLPLFVTAVSIQSSTGGNLREILDGLSATIRERGKLRRKVRSISVEGRMSAYILTALPVLLLTAIVVLNPSYYGAVLDQSLTWWLLGGAFFWLVLGNLMMFKMSNFRF